MTAFIQQIFAAQLGQASGTVAGAAVSDATTHRRTRHVVRALKKRMALTRQTRPRAAGRAPLRNRNLPQICRPSRGSTGSEGKEATTTNWAYSMAPTW